MDPQRLLQIQQAANPSLRAAATPASILQGGNVTPQYSVSPQGNNFNPQAQQINYTTPVAAPYRLSGPVQVAHPQPLYVGNPMNPATSVISSGSGVAGARDYTPVGNFQDAIVGAGQGALHGITGLAGGTVSSVIRAPLVFSNAFANLGTHLAGGKGQSTEQQFAHTPGANQLNQTAAFTRNLADAPLNAYNSFGQSKGFIGTNNLMTTKAGKVGERVGGDIVNVAALAAPAKDALALGTKAIKGGASLVRVAKGLFSTSEKKALEQAGIQVTEDGAAPTALTTESAPTEAAPPESAPVETPTEPTPTTETPKSTPAEATPKETGVPSRAEPPASAPKAPLTDEQQKIIDEFPDGFTNKDAGVLKKQGYPDNIIAQMKQQVDDAHAANTPTPEQTVGKATAENTAAPTEHISQAETQKAAQETTGKVASETPTGEHYLDSTTGKSVPVDTMHPKYARNALNKMLRDHSETKDSSLAQALEARSKGGAPVKPVSDIPNLTSKESKLTKLNSLEYRADKLGNSGKEFNDLTRQKRIDAQVIRQRMEDTLQPFHDLTPQEQEVAVDVKEGKATTDDPNIQAGVQALHDFYKGTHETLTNNGVKMGDLGNAYFNHNYPKGFFDKPDNFNAAVKSLVDSGKVDNIQDAIRIVSGFKKDTNFSPSRFGNLKSREADVPGYLKNSDAVSQYAKQAAEHIAAVKNFGVKGEHLDALVGKAVANGEDAGAMQDIVKSYANPKTPGKGIGSRALTGYQKVLNVLQLPRAVVSHIPQLFTNTGSDVGFSRVAKGIKDTISDPETQRFLHDAGFDLKEKSPGLANRATAPGLQTVLHEYRAFSGAAGRNVALGLAKKGDVEGLSKMGVTGHVDMNPDGSINLTHDQQVQAAHFVADKNIGTDDIAQSPAWTQDEKGKIMSAYQRMYVFKQGERIINMMKDARNGNVAPLARYIGVAAPAAGAAITVAKNEIKNPGSNPLPTDAKSAKTFATDTFKNSGIGSLGLGLVDKGVNAATHNYNNDSRWQNVAGAIAPGAGFAVQTGQNVAKASHGKPNALERQGFGLVPVGGKALADHFAPTQTNTFRNGTNTGPPKTVADLKAQNQKVGADFTKSLSASDRKNFTDNKGNFIDYNTATEAHKQGVLSDEQYNHYLGLEKVLQREQGKSKYVYDNPDLDAAHASGKISDDEYNLIKQYDQHSAQSNADLTAEGKKKLAGRGGDQISQQINQKIADTVNASKPPGLNDLKADPDLAKSYVDFLKTTAKDAAKAPEDQETAIDYQDRTIRFWAQAAKDGAPANVQSIYRDGGNKAAMFLKQGKATPDDIDQAVALDNMLLASQIETTPKFSKKWRAANGYPAASDFMEGGAHFGTAGVGQYLSDGSNATVATGAGKGTGSGKKGFGNGTTTALNDGSGIFSSVNKKTGAVTLKAVPSLNGTGTTSGVVDPDTGLFISKPTGIKDLLNTKDTTFKSPGMNLPALSKPQAPPKLKSFAAPDVRGTPRPQRAVPIRFQRAKFK